MNKVIYPPALLDRWDIADLSVEHKLVVTMLAVHRQLSCCLVFTVTNYSTRSLPLPTDVILGLLDDLDRRGVVVFDNGTGEAYLVGSFSWHRVPEVGGDDRWSRQVWAAVDKVRSRRVRAAVEDELAEPPLARESAILIPTNLLTALPARHGGQRWSATEMLVAFVLVGNPEQTVAGVFRPAALDSLAALASVPLPTLVEVIDSLAALGVAAYDAETGELFVATRLRCAERRDHRRIDAEAQLIDSPLIFRVFLSCAKRYGIKVQENQRHDAYVIKSRYKGDGKGGSLGITQFNETWQKSGGKIKMRPEECQGGGAPAPP